jgi:hypothetical protein
MVAALDAAGRCIEDLKAALMHLDKALALKTGPTINTPQQTTH